MSIVVIDYGMGNIASVANMVSKVGGQAEITNEIKKLSVASKLILPGVGAFDYGVNQLHKLGIFTAIQEMVTKGTPILGICLGMQLLSNRSEEGRLDGLGLIDAEFKRFSFEKSPSLPIPHVGWNHIRVVKENPLIPCDSQEQRFYFTHSYHAICAHHIDVLATSEYGYSFTAAYCRGNLFGVQFHPEKSHRFGMALVKKFVELQ